MDENPNHIPFFDDVSNYQTVVFLCVILSVLYTEENSRTRTHQAGRHGFSEKVRGELFEVRGLDEIRKDIDTNVLV